MDKMAEALTYMCVTIRLACGRQGCGLEDFCIIRTWSNNKGEEGDAYFWEEAAKNAVLQKMQLIPERFAMATYTPDTDKRKKNRMVITYDEHNNEDEQ